MVAITLVAIISVFVWLLQQKAKVEELGMETEKGRKTLTGDLWSRWLVGVTGAQFLWGTLRDKAEQPQYYPHPRGEKAEVFIHQLSVIGWGLFVGTLTFLHFCPVLHAGPVCPKSREMTTGRKNQSDFSKWPFKYRSEHIGDKGRAPAGSASFSLTQTLLISLSPLWWSYFMMLL